jgi:hypothetical protein
MINRVLACLVVLIVCSCTNTPKNKEAAKRQPAFVQSAAAATVPYEFGFADTTGKRLLALDYQERPAALTRAACPGSGPLAVRFIGERKSWEEDTGRDTARNFDALGGFYYQITDGKTTEDTICLLTDERFFTGKKDLPLLPGEDKPDAKTLGRIAAAKQRRVKEARGMGRLAPDRELYFVLFERKGESALFSIVMATPERLVFLDFPGSYKDEGSVWRVDDGGEIDPLLFDIEQAFESARGVEFTYWWRGAEGDSVGLVQETGSSFRTIKRSYKYMAPL